MGNLTNDCLSSRYLDKVRLAQRLTTNAFDSELVDLIQECRADLMQLGVRQEKAEDETDSLVLGAVRAFVRWRFTSDDKLAALSRGDYMLMRDELRKRTDYREEADA